MSAYGEAAYGQAAYGVDMGHPRRALTLKWDVKTLIPQTTPKLPTITEIDTRPQTAEIIAVEKRGER